MKIKVLVFTCDTCPIAQAYKDRIVACSVKHPDVEFVAINSNPREGRASGRWPFEYRYEPLQGTARTYGATVTPHVFVLNDRGEVVYNGAVDDKEEKPTVNYLDAAIVALKAGRKPDPAYIEPYGCRIQYKKYPRL